LFFFFSFKSQEQPLADLVCIEYHSLKPGLPWSPVLSYQLSCYIYFTGSEMLACLYSVTEHIDLDYLQFK